MNTAETLYRLHGILPLKDRQRRLSRKEKVCHQSILLSFVEQGRALEDSEIAGMLGQSDAKSFLSQLSADDLIVLGNRGEVIGAYPLTIEKTPHTLKINGQQIYAMCALDALAVSSMFNREVSINSRCAMSGEPIYLRQRGLELLKSVPSDEILLGIHWQEVTDCAAHSMCQEMVFLKNLDVAINWQNLAPEARELFNLQEAVKLAQAFFAPLMQKQVNN